METNLEWIQQHNAELTVIKNAIKKPTVNGVQGQYAVTADISIGDFVQLTTKGVEEPAFTELAAWTNGTTGLNGVGVAVLSDTKIIWTYVQYEGKYTTSGVKNVYAQAAIYNGAAWITGEPILLNSTTTTYYSVGIGRLDDSTAAVTYQAQTGGTASLYVLSVDNGGSVTIADSAVDFAEIGYAYYNPPLVVALSSSHFITFIARNSTSYSGVQAVACTYVDGVLTAGTPVQIFAGSTSEDGKFYACKLNDDTVVVSCTAGGSLAYTNAVKHLYTVQATGTTVTFANAALTGRPGPIAYVENNKIIHCPVAKGYNYDYLTYDPETGTFTAEDVIDMSEADLYTFDMERISDNKIYALVSTATSAPTVYTQLIADLTTGTYTTAESSISGVGHLLAHAMARLSARNGWLAAMSGITAAQVAPVVTQITAAPYDTRIDGVAMGNATAGNEVIVISPERTAGA